MSPKQTISRTVVHEKPSASPTPISYHPKYFDTQSSIKISQTKDDRLAYVRSIAERSPGPIYNEPKHHVKATTFATSKRELNLASEVSDHCYLGHSSPTARGFRFSTSNRTKLAPNRSLSESPGPSTYNIAADNSTKTYSIMRQTGRKDLFSRHYSDLSSMSPGVGTYSPRDLKTSRNLYSIPQSRRRLEPKMSEM